MPQSTSSSTTTNCLQEWLDNNTYNFTHKNFMHKNTLIYMKYYTLVTFANKLFLALWLAKTNHISAGILSSFSTSEYI